MAVRTHRAPGGGVCLLPASLLPTALPRPGTAASLCSGRRAPSQRVVAPILLLLGFAREGSNPRDPEMDQLLSWQPLAPCVGLGFPDWEWLNPTLLTISLGIGEALTVLF